MDEQGDTSAPKDNYDEKRHRHIEREYWAHSARLSRLAAVGTIIAAVSGSLALIASFIAAKEAYNQAYEASEQTRIAESSLISGQRAYISLSGIEVSTSINDLPNFKGWVFQPLWTNTGSTPTKRLKTAVFVPYVKQVTPGDFAGEDVGKQFSSVRTIWKDGFIAPKDNLTGEVIAVPISRLVEIQNSKILYTITGEAIYYDQFSQAPRFTRFCYYVASVSGNPTDLSSQIKLSLRQCYRSGTNCTDDECHEQDSPIPHPPFG